VVAAAALFFTSLGAGAVLHRLAEARSS
jgi:hypothetical protein